jgi:hypothetical protein
MTLLTQGLLIGFFGSGLYFAVDEYEPDRAVAFMLKLLVVMWGASVLLHQTSTTLADLLTLLFLADPGSAVWTSLRT